MWGASQWGVDVGFMLMLAPLDNQAKSRWTSLSIESAWNNKVQEAKIREQTNIPNAGGV
jgi:hypothetical protein